MYFCCYNYLPVLADYVIDLPLENYINANALPLHNYPKLEIEKLKNGDKIFIKTDYLPFFLTNILQHINIRFILITGVSDFEIDNRYLPFLNSDKIIKWIGVNISIQNHPKIIKMLIGFAEPSRQNYNQDNLYKIYNTKNDFNNKINKLLITYCGNTHNSRNNINEIFKHEKFTNFTDFANKLEYEDYLKKINDYKFVLCPRGNGIDTHRFTEILFMGSVPIVEKNGLSDLYEKFPCIIVDNFEDITFDMLNNFVFDMNKYELFKSHLFINNIHNLLKI
jgi:hypothetical protein